jgi:hypothetical protein
MQKISKKLVLSMFFCDETKTGNTFGTGQVYKVEFGTLQLKKNTASVKDSGI